MTDVGPTTEGFADRLDATLAALKASGAEIVRILTDPAHVETLFMERGEASIFMDADPKRDIAWYQGEFELLARAEPGASVLYKRDQVLAYAVLDGEPPPPPPPSDEPEATDHQDERAAA